MTGSACPKIFTMYPIIYCILQKRTTRAVGVAQPSPTWAQLEARRARLEEMQEAGQAGLEEGRGELRVAAERLEAEKDKFKASRNVSMSEWLRTKLEVVRLRGPPYGGEFRGDFFVGIFKECWATTV